MTALLRRTPLRVKLVAAVLALAAVALAIISVASTFALRSYLMDRTDEQLQALAGQLLEGQSVLESAIFTPNPSSYVIAVHDGRQPTWLWAKVDTPALPALPTDRAALLAQASRPYTELGRDDQVRWRMLLVPLPNGAVLIVGQDQANVDRAVVNLVWVEVLVGVAVLILVGVVGTAIVGKSLRPLVQIEQTAAAIAAGDLTRRVPDPEPRGELPQTELGRLGRALNAMLAQIEAAFTARTESEARALRSEERMRRFVADASHELRTPLTSIRGFAELYRQGAVSSPEEVARLVRRIEDEAARMGLLVEDLLLLARLDRERPLELAPVELPVIAADAVQAARAVDPDRPVALEVRPDGVPLVVAGDDARLRQVLGNLLSNALTHTPPGSPVAVRLRGEPVVGGHVAVMEVVDEGPGLAPEQAERVFERFYRVDSARTRPAGATPERHRLAGARGGGTGLGLAIVAAIVAAHRGTVTVDSAPGKGATFRVVLPLAPEAIDGQLVDSGPGATGEG